MARVAFCLMIFAWGLLLGGLLRDLLAERQLPVRVECVPQELQI